MAKISQYRIADIERHRPRQKPLFVIDETFVEAIDGLPGRSYVAFRIEILPERHPFAEKQLHFAEFSSLVTRRTWGMKKGGPWTVVEVFDQPAPIDGLPDFDMNAAIRWRLTCPDEFAEHWAKEPESRWIRALTRLAALGS